MSASYLQMVIQRINRKKETKKKRRKGGRGRGRKGWSEEI